MELAYYITRLQANKQVFEHLVAAISQVEASWRPSEDKWSILEVINHLYDEERLDFRHRLELTLFHPDQIWPEIDPPRWVIEQQYNKRMLADSLKEFLNERDRSLDWLKELADPDWQLRYHHKLGVIRAGDLMASWLAHDLLHIRQITRLQWEYLSAFAKPFSTVYAGNL